MPSMMRSLKRESSVSLQLFRALGKLLQVQSAYPCPCLTWLIKNSIQEKFWNIPQKFHSCSVTFDLFRSQADIAELPTKRMINAVYGEFFLSDSLSFGGIQQYATNFSQFIIHFYISDGISLT